VHNDHPPEYHALDDDWAPRNELDLVNGERIEHIENALEVIPLAPVVPGDRATATVVYCLRQGGPADPPDVIVYFWQPVDEKGRYVGRLVRWSGDRGAHVLSEGMLTNFTIRNVVEYSPHPGNVDIGCWYRKFFFDVDVTAEGPAELRRLAPRPFTMHKVLYPPYANQACFARWLPVGRAR